MTDDSDRSTGPDKNMPLRDNRHQVELVQLPGRKTPMLGYTYGPEEVDIRLRSAEHWNDDAGSHRTTTDTDTAQVRTALDRRQQTILSYKLSEPDRARVNRMQIDQPNQGRRTNPDSGERIDVKIRD